MQGTSAVYANQLLRAHSKDLMIIWLTLVDPSEILGLSFSLLTESLDDSHFNAFLRGLVPEAGRRCAVNQHFRRGLAQAPTISGVGSHTAYAEGQGIGPLTNFEGGMVSQHVAHCCSYVPPACDPNHFHSGPRGRCHHDDCRI